MKRKKGFSLVLLAGAALLLAGLIGLAGVPKLTQYAFLPPAEGERNLSENLESLRGALGEEFPMTVLHGQKSGVTLTAGSVSENDVLLYQTGPSWQEVYPRAFVSGRPVSREEAERGAAVIVLDEETAFRLFGAEDPLGKSVTLGTAQLEVIGVAKHGRRIGEAAPRAAWVPLGTVKENDLMVVTASGAGSAGLVTMFQTEAKTAFGPGTVISLSREKTGATMLLRILFLLLAVWGLKRAAAHLGRYARSQWARVREESRRRYAARLIPYALGRLLPVALLSAAAIAAGYGLALLAVQPLQVFPEWVPESLGTFSDWGSRFWDLTARAAAPVSLQTPELAEIRFWGGLVQWGTALCALAGWMLRPGKGAAEEKEA